jgi:hypothetical protein
MISRKAKNLVPAREQLEALTPAELTQVSGGCGGGGEDGSYGSYYGSYYGSDDGWRDDDGYRHCRRYRRHCHGRDFGFI